MSDDLPLGPDDAARLDAFLREQEIPGPNLGIEFLDGYLTALQCCPVEVDTDEWAAAFFGDSLVELPDAQVNEMLGLVTRLWNQVAADLDVGGAEPRIDPSAKLPGARWCQGFLAATELASSAWQGLSRGPHGGLLTPMTLLAIDPELRSAAGDDADEEEAGAVDALAAAAAQLGPGRRARLVDELPDAVQSLHDLWRAPMEPVRSAPKPGRNDPCSCGSGKKYKVCCGKAG